MALSSQLNERVSSYEISMARYSAPAPTQEMAVQVWLCCG